MLTVLSMFSPCTQWVFGPLSPVGFGCVVVAKFDLQEIGNPHTTLARRWAYCLYSLHTIDVGGDKGTAE